MANRPPQDYSLEEPTNATTSQHGQTEYTHRQKASKAGDTLDPGQTITKPSSAKLPQANEILDTQVPIRQTLPHLYYSSGGSRSPSTRTSSSSLQALNEDTVVDARSDRSMFSRMSLSRRTSYNRQADSPTPEYPVYPDQSYAVLQSQIHPTYQPQSLRTRSSYSSDAPPRPGQFRGAYTAGNTPITSPGLYSHRSPGFSPPNGSESDLSGRSYLHPTHLQPPKE